MDDRLVEIYNIISENYQGVAKMKTGAKRAQPNAFVQRFGSAPLLTNNFTI